MNGSVVRFVIRSTLRQAQGERTVFFAGYKMLYPAEVRQFRTQYYKYAPPYCQQRRSGPTAQKKAGLRARLLYIT